MSTRSVALKAIKQARYKERAAQLRKYFDGFSASEGFDLRSPATWSAQDKAKVTRYWETMGIQIARPHAVKRYRKPEHIKAAAVFAQQDRQLKGQRAVLIPTDDPKTLEVTFSKDARIRVKRRGIVVGKLFFNKKEFLADPIKELNRVLNTSDATVFKFMNGPHESRGAYSRDELERRIMMIISEYGSEMYDIDDRRSHHWKNWLTGLIPYSVKDAEKVLKQSVKYAKLRDETRRARLRKRASDEYRITKRARLTGRR